MSGPATSSTTIQSPSITMEVFQARCEARAHLYASGDILDIHDAVDALQEHAVKHGVLQIGQDAVQAIIAAAFRQVRAEDAS